MCFTLYKPRFAGCLCKGASNSYAKVKQNMHDFREDVGFSSPVVHGTAETVFHVFPFDTELIVVNFSSYNLYRSN